MKTEGFLYIWHMKIAVYDKYEAYYQREAYRNGFSLSGKSGLWEEKEVTEEELLALARRGEKILVNP